VRSLVFTLPMQHKHHPLLLGASPLMLLIPHSANAATASDSRIEQIQKLTSEINDYIMDRCAQFGWDNIAWYAVASIAVAIISAFLVSKLFTELKGTLWNAVRFNFGSIIAGGLGFWMAYQLFMNGKFGMSLGALFAAAIAMVIIAGKVYEIHYPRAIGFILCWGLVESIADIPIQGAFAGEKGMPWSNIFNLPPEEVKRKLSEWRISNKEQNPHAVATQDLRVIYERLQAARANLDSNNPAAVAGFNKQVAQYEELMKKSSHPAPPIAPTPSPQKPK
jgi:hypothetical protein